MPQKPKVDQSKLENALQLKLLERPQSAKELCSHLAISQPSLSRLVANTKLKVLKFGIARDTKYCIVQKLEWAPLEILLYRITEKGESILLGHLWVVAGGGFVFDSNNSQKYYSDLPFFLDPMRAQGYLGRLVPTELPELSLPVDIKFWQELHHLKHWVSAGSDLPGDLVVGQASLAQALAHEKLPFIKLDERKTKYPKLALSQLNKGHAGSSAAGEQPKFLAYKEPGIWVLVKFSPPVNSAVGRRWADLLICEEISLNNANKLIFKSAPTAAIVTKDRVYLESERFDRIGPRGRRGVMPLQTLDGEFVGSLGSWREVATGLYGQKLISKSDAETITLLDMYGVLTANTDRHLGNLSVFPNDDFSRFKLAPIYDIPPMYFAPKNDQLTSKPYTPSLFIGPQSLWKKALNVATLFWESVIEDKRISKEFRNIAKVTLAQIKSTHEIVERMPKDRI